MNSRETALRARPAAQVFTDSLAGMRRVLTDDRLYLAMLCQVEGWIVGQRSWLEGVANQRAADANPGERHDGDGPQDRRVSLPLVGTEKVQT